jgi:ribosomal protein S18 acetylase RimI-like enzyme
LENVVIRRMEIGDVEEVGEIQERITKSEVTEDFLDIIRGYAVKPDNACFVAEYEGRVVGFMISSILSGVFGAEKSAWIALLGVDPKFMGRDLGRALAREIFAFYRERGIKHIYTSVRWDSTDLLSFFKTLGFDRSNFINLRRVLD